MYSESLIKSGGCSFMITFVHVILFLLFFIFSAINIFLEVRHKERELKYKIMRAVPIFVLWIIVILSFLRSYNLTPLTFGLLVGMPFCYIADFLMTDRHRPRTFVKGLILFMVGYLMYSCALIVEGRFYLPLVPIIIILSVGVVQYTVLDRRIILREMKTPVVAYMMVVSLLLLSAYALFEINLTLRTIFIFLAALLIYLSDGIINHSCCVRRNLNIPIMLTYYLAQLSFVASLFLTGTATI